MKKIIIFITLSIVLCSASSFGQKGAPDLLNMNKRKASSSTARAAAEDKSYEQTLANLPTAQAAAKESDRQLKAASTATATAKANIAAAETKINSLEESVKATEQQARDARREQQKAGKTVQANIAAKVKAGEYAKCEDIELCKYNLSVKELKDMEEQLKKARQDLDNAENSAEEAEAAYRRAKVAESKAKEKNTKDSKELNKLEERIAEYERRAERDANRSDIRDDLNEFHRKHGQVKDAYWKMYSKFEQQKLAAYLRQKLYETLNSNAFCEAKANCGTDKQGKLNPDVMKEIFPITPGSALTRQQSSSVGSGNGVAR